MRWLPLIISVLTVLAVLLLFPPRHETETLLGKHRTSYFAEISGNTVVRVIVADQAFIDSGAVGDPSNWVQTFKDDSQKKHFAGVGYTYDTSRDAFIPPRGTDTDIFDEAKAQWEYSANNPKKPKPPTK